MDNVTVLVTAQEAVTLAGYRTIADFRVCEQISAEHYKKATQRNYDELWSYITLLATIWNAGRIQGIREERKNKRK